MRERGTQSLGRGRSVTAAEDLSREECSDTPYDFKGSLRERKLLFLFYQSSPMVHCAGGRDADSPAYLKQET